LKYERKQLKTVLFKVIYDICGLVFVQKRDPMAFILHFIFYKQ